MFFRDVCREKVTGEVVTFSIYFTQFTKKNSNIVEQTKQPPNSKILLNITRK